MEDVSPALALYQSINQYSDLQRLIDEAQSEGQYLEFKAPRTPNLTRDLQTTLAKEVSAFRNSGGGVIIWGASTTNHAHSGLDVISQLEPIGNVRQFLDSLVVQFATSVYPAFQVVEQKIIIEKHSDTRGFVISHIPGTLGDPVKSLKDNTFYLRAGARCEEMPYDILKKMFTANDSPDLLPLLDSRLVRVESGGKWSISLMVDNQSSAAAMYTRVDVTLINSQDCASIQTTPEFSDISDLNPGIKVFSCEVVKPIFRGSPIVLGKLLVVMAKTSRAKRSLKLQIDIYSTRMRAKSFIISLSLAKKKFVWKETAHKYLY